MLRPVFAFVGIAMSVGPLHSQQAKTKVTDDIVFVSGHYPRPIIGRQQSAAEDTATAVADGEAIKHPVLKVRPQKVAVSKSGDMAYGFALFDLEFDRPDSAGKTEHVKFEGSQLSVWRKIGGEWRLAASFNRPNEWTARLAPVRLVP